MRASRAMGNQQDTGKGPDLAIEACEGETRRVCLTAGPTGLRTAGQPHAQAGFSQTVRHIAVAKLRNLVEGARIARAGLDQAPTAVLYRSHSRRRFSITAANPASLRTRSKLGSRSSKG